MVKQKIHIKTVKINYIKYMRIQNKVRIENIPYIMQIVFKKS